MRSELTDTAVRLKREGKSVATIAKSVVRALKRDSDED